MAEFNKIFTTASVNVVPQELALLGFNNGRAMIKSKFALENHTLTLLEETRDFISIFHNNGVATVYEFDAKLSGTNTQMATIDNNQKLVSNLVKSNLLVFIDGELQPIDAYDVLEGNILVIKNSYTSNPNKIFKVIIYSSKIAFTRKDLDINSLDDEAIDYKTNNTIIFKNGYAVNFNNIDQLSDGHYKLNITKADIETLEYVKLDNNTLGLHFNAEFGYLTYGPYDEFGNMIPLNYNVLLQFSDQVKLIIDNLRQGFIVKEENGFGELVVVDDNFETTHLKCLQVQPFKNSNYAKDEYYFEVPECVSIVKYLASYDKKYSFLPEILNIFQRMLLNDINDTIERIRESRSISKVDSVSINKLISLLGFNLNIKTLNKKQRRELIEELNEFYRIAGTKDAYNLINILQNNLKLINMEQLFTPHYTIQKDKDIIYNYNCYVDQANKGTGYTNGDVLRATGTDIYLTVTNTDAGGGITGFETEVEEGYNPANGVYPLTSGVNGLFNVTSIPGAYNYTWSVTNSTGYQTSIGKRLKTADGKYFLTINATNPLGEITQFTPSITSGPNIINVLNQVLYLEEAELSVKISREGTAGNKILLKSSATGGDTFDLVLEPGTYFVKMSGGGGGGGAADSTTGSHYDLPALAGGKGEYKEYTFALNNTKTIKATVGQGGGRVYARGHDGAPAWDNQLGAGYSRGEKGEGLHYSAGNLVGGSGGGSTGISIDGSTLVEARGGNGGKAYRTYTVATTVTTSRIATTPHTKVVTVTAAGGLGGGGGIDNGTGANGGARSDASFWSKIGSDGYIEIYKIDQYYKFNVIGNTAQVADNEVFKTINCPTEFTLTAHVDGTVVTWTGSPLYGMDVFDSEEAYTLQPVNENSTARLTITSALTAYSYNLTTSLDTKYLTEGKSFKNSNTDPNKVFTYTVTSVDKINNTYTGVYSPVSGNTSITLVDAIASMQVGQNASLTVNSTRNTQKNEEREYIDFFTKKELGAEYKKEYREQIEDYGEITIGTPGSPKFWEVGEPDIEYGSITATEVDEYIDYGNVSEKVAGKWVEWWEWNRNPIYYPTNHVEVEMKMPTDVDFTDYMVRFIEQFYNLASTVVYIHQLTESFYFGQESATNIAKSFLGIMTGSPIQYEEMTVTSNPLIQYVESKPTDCTFTIVPTPLDSTVMLEAEVEGETITVSGTGVQSITVPYETDVNWSVTHTDYVSRHTVRNVKRTVTKYVILEHEYVPVDIYHTFTINPTPADATVTLTATGYVQEGNSITVVKNTPIVWSVSKTGYTPRSESFTVTQDYTLPVVLTELANYTLTVTPDPLTATVTLTAPGYETVSGVGQQQITVLGGTVVTAEAALLGYKTETTTRMVSSNSVLPIKIYPVVDLEDYAYTTNTSYNVSLTDYTGSGTTITTPHI